MSTDALPKPTSIHWLTITLSWQEPGVWRTVAVPSDASLGYLHEVIQLAMGWEDIHPHNFRIGKKLYRDMDAPVNENEEEYVEYVDPDDPEGDYDLEEEHENWVTVAWVVPQVGDSLRYTYDFGDHWVHEVVVKAIAAPEPGVRYPIILDGEFACPPEDCGGALGYNDMLEVLHNPRHPSHVSLLEWLGGPFHPYEFDVDEANKVLREEFEEG